MQYLRRHGAWWRRWMAPVAVVLAVGVGAGAGVLEASGGTPAGAEDPVPPLVQALWPELKPEAVQPAAVAGWREIVTPDGQVIYLDPSQRYAVMGRLVDLWSRRDLTQERLERDRVSVVREIDDADVIWIKPDPDHAARGRLYVFDDPDCPYCREAHPRLAELAAQGIEVGVLLDPVVRLHPQAYGKSVAIWCAEDRRGALDRAMRGEALAAPAAACAHPVDRNLRLARRLGVTGTPYWVAPSGKALAGARTLEELLALSGLNGAGPSTRQTHQHQGGSDATDQSR